MSSSCVNIENMNFRSLEHQCVASSTSPVKVKLQNVHLICGCAVMPWKTLDTAPGVLVIHKDSPLRCITHFRVWMLTVSIISWVACGLANGWTMGCYVACRPSPQTTSFPLLNVRKYFKDICYSTPSPPKSTNPHVPHHPFQNPSIPMFHPTSS